MGRTLMVGEYTQQPPASRRATGGRRVRRDSAAARCRRLRPAVVAAVPASNEVVGAPSVVESVASSNVASAPDASAPVSDPCRLARRPASPASAARSSAASDCARSASFCAGVGRHLGRALGDRSGLDRRDGRELGGLGGHLAGDGRGLGRDVVDHRLELREPLAALGVRRAGRRRRSPANGSSPGGVRSRRGSGRSWVPPMRAACRSRCVWDVHCRPCGDSRTCRSSPAISRGRPPARRPPRGCAASPPPGSSAAATSARLVGGLGVEQVVVLDGAQGEPELRAAGRPAAGPDPAAHRPDQPVAHEQADPGPGRRRRGRRRAVEQREQVAELLRADAGCPGRARAR